MEIRCFVIVKNNCLLNGVYCTEGVVFCVKVESRTAKNNLVALRANLKRGGTTIPRL